TFTGFLSAYGLYRHYYSSILPSAEKVFTHFPFMHGNHPLLYVALMTFILIMSSVTMVLAVEAGHRMDKKGVTLWLGLTLIGGAIFLGSQAWEWYHFIHGTELGAIELGKGYFTLPDGTVESTKGIIARWTNESKQALLLPWKDGADYITITGAQLNEFITNGKEIHGANLTHNEYGHPLFGDFFFFITGFHGTHVFSGVVINFIVFVNVIMGTYQKRGHYEMVEKVGLYWHFVDLVWVFVFTFFYLI
ncbi:MAG: cytochrome c oxidase subunit 3, partial [Vicingaceae bacterium]|nr:cytochrome c oxidase subunit 3 [Vicingaceae bacterium]